MRRAARPSVSYEPVDFMTDSVATPSETRRNPDSRSKDVDVHLPLLSVFGSEEFIGTFSQQRTIEAWVEVEVALAAVQADLGVIPREAARKIAAALSIIVIDRDLLRERSREVGYPILSLLEQLVSEQPDDVQSFLHWGATTQDIIDTALVLQLRAAGQTIDRGLVRLGDRIAELALRERSTVMAGRTHGRQAVPITLGMKLGVWLDETRRHLGRWRRSRADVEVVQLFGAAGTAAAYGATSQETRRRLAERLGLACVDVPRHVARDTIAEMILVAGMVAATCGRFAQEIIDLSRTEVGELAEGSGHLRGASSTMPQKANPVQCEAVVGLASMAGRIAPLAYEAMRGTHERSAGQWQAEWDTVPLALSYADAAIERISDAIEGLVVNRDAMASNLNADGGLLMAEAAMMALAPLVGRSAAHTTIYEIGEVARANGWTLEGAVEAVLKDESQSAEVLKALDPYQYLGEAEQIADRAVESWRRKDASP